PIPNVAMGNATSLFNLVRNLGGSIGIAAVSTIQTRREQTNIDVLGAHVNRSHTSVQMMTALKQHFISRGLDPVTADHQAYAALFSMVEQQASMIAYNTTFRILGVIFLGMLPFLFLMRRPQKAHAATAH